MNWAEQIIKAGYKEVLKHQHPDANPGKSAEAQNEICQKLAVERDRLLEMVKRHHRVRPPIITVPAAQPGSDPLTGIEGFIDELAEAIGKGLKRTVRQAVRPRR
jgi:hypothetical protein